MGRHGSGEPIEAFEERLRSLDPGLFDCVPSQTDSRDRVALLALHNACRDVHGTFRYLEIGSHLGGSLQVLLADARCTAITSIDPRPLSQPDDRGIHARYPGNSTERMLRHLESVPGADFTKLHTIEAGTDHVPTNGLEGTAELCFIDGEHTHEAALRDARFCRVVVDDRGAIAFHDSQLVRGAIKEFTAGLGPGTFTAYRLGTSLLVVELGPARLMPSDWIAEQSPVVVASYQ